MTNLESLADELLLDLFEFFDTIHLFRAFHGLNSRFDGLLFNLFQAYRLDFRSITKHDFNILCDEYLPQISYQTIALRLSDDDDTPQQTELFLLRDNLFHQFTRLKAFSLYHVFSKEIMETLSFQLENLPTLTHLDIIQCCLPCDRINILNFIDRIWSLPKLVYCNLDIYLQDEGYFVAPTVISSSIEYVSIKGLLFELNETNLLFENTPCLHYLKAHSYCVTDDVDPISYVSSLITLNLSFVTMNENVIINFLQSMRNLHRLTIDMYGVCVDGYQWEQIIRDYLPNLKIFRLKEQIPVANQNQDDQKLDALLKSFQSRFWLDERKWFVRCDWNLADTYSFISLYTLPYSFTEFNIDYLLNSTSTCPQNNYDGSYHLVHKLYCNTSLNDDEPPAHLYFPHLRHLTAELPIHDRFWSILLELDQLTTLDISLSDADITISQWQILLNRATNLRSLKINSSSLSVIISFIQNINISVCRLNFQGNDQWFDDEQCTILINSSLGVQCEILAIDIKSCNSILDLVNNMINLRALKVRCEDDEWDFDLLLSENDDFVGWLRTCLPSTCTITRDTYSFDDIHLWIR